MPDATMPDPGADAIARFISRWSAAGGSERANYQLFLTELVSLLELPTPDPASDDTRDNAYVFERRVRFLHGDGSDSTGFIDLYRRGSFVLEAKKLRGMTTGGFDAALLRARSQAESYARALPADEGRPPFLVVVDVGHVIELYSDFSRSGATYVPFPDPRSHRIRLDQLRDPALRARLRQVWLDPVTLDPSRQAAKVTREIAERLARIARALAGAGYAAERVAGFLSRCLFTFFAEDVELIPKRSFADLLDSLVVDPSQFVPMVGELWKAMDEGKFSVALRATLPRFNGKLFKDPEVLPLNRDQITLLREAAKSDWTFVEPAIFGTLLERALDPRERHSLGAHFTPRAYVERLVLPTVIEPLREEWRDVQAAALTLAAEGNNKDARTEIRAFQQRLCNIRVLDPACGSGNFLYVALEHLKRLEGEVLLQREALGVSLSFEAEGLTVDPHQFLGIEINPRAAAIAELVLWIGYLQWHFRTRGHVLPSEPVLRDFRNIECRDAVLAYDRIEPVLDEHGQPVTHWDGRTTKTHPVTGEPVPDDTARVPSKRYINPRKAEWPQADFVVGNPPFIGNKRMRSALGDGYVEALRNAWSDVPDSADFVLYWWHHAAELTRRGQLRRFGLITTNSLRQAFNRRVIETQLADKKQPLSLVFAIPDHPWVDSTDGAAVRIAMTVGTSGTAPGAIFEVGAETVAGDGESVVELRARTGFINANLTVGPNVARAERLRANRGLACPGVQLSGQGFILQPDDLVRFSDQAKNALIRPYITGRDLTQLPRTQWVIDTFGLAESELLSMFPDVYQHLKDHVLPDRLGVTTASKDVAKYAEDWWLHSKPRTTFRAALKGLSRVVVTSRTAKYRVFSFLAVSVLPETKVLIFALDSVADLGVLSSVVHTSFAKAAGGWHGVGNDLTYNHSDCFEKFPFPAESASDADRISTIAEQLDVHRKRQQAAHPTLTLTGMYNVLEKLKTGEALTEKEKVIHEQGLVSVLKQLHDDLDLAVLDAYGWTDLAPVMQVVNGNAAATTTRDDAVRELDEALLERLVALNAERAAEEKRGLIRWLRPEFQNSSGATSQTQREIGLEDEGGDDVAAASVVRPWPKDLTEQVRAVAAMLAETASPLTESDIAARFTGRGAWRRRLPQLLEMLAALGRAREVEGGRYSGSL